MASTRRGRGDRGQAVPLVIGVLAIAGVVGLGLARFAAGTIDAARARTAADAAALAGASAGRGAAAAVAGANGGTLESFTTVGGDVIVVVRIGVARATARATLVLAGAPP